MFSAAPLDVTVGVRGFHTPALYRGSQSGTYSTELVLRVMRLVLQGMCFLLHPKQCVQPLSRVNPGSSLMPRLLILVRCQGYSSEKFGVKMVFTIVVQLSDVNEPVAEIVSPKGILQ